MSIFTTKNISIFGLGRVKQFRLGLAAALRFVSGGGGLLVMFSAIMPKICSVSSSIWNELYS